MLEILAAAPPRRHLLFPLLIILLLRLPLHVKMRGNKYLEAYCYEPNVRSIKPKESLRITCIHQDSKAPRNFIGGN